MASGDHHPGRRTGGHDVPGQHRRGHRVVEQQRPHATGSAHPRRVEGEQIALASGVVADDHAASSGIGGYGQQVLDQASSSLAHHQAVHALRANTDCSAQARSAELQAPGEPSLQLEGVADQQGSELGAHVGIGFGGKPAFGLRPGWRSVAHTASVRSSTNGRGPTCEITSPAAMAPRRAHSDRLRWRVYP